MRLSARPVLLLVGALLLGPPAGLAAADEPAPAPAAPSPAAPSPAAVAAAKVRASIPAPLEPAEGKPGMGFEFQGDLVVAGEPAGTVRYVVDVGSFRNKPVWLVSETVVEAWAGTSVTTETSLFLSQDLTLLKGEWQRTAPGRITRLDFKRDGAAFEVTSQVTDASGEQPSTTRSLPAPGDATYGRGALLLFLRYAPSGAAAYDLPMVSLESVMPAVDEHEAAPDPAPARVEVKGPAKLGEKPKVVDTWMAVWRHAGRVLAVHLEPKTRALLGIEWERPPGIRIVPKGTAGAAVVYEDDQPAKTWRACFLKFGHGYHMAVEKWLDAAFHWPSLHASDVASGSYPKEASVEDLKKAYIAEFLKKSKHRPREQADGLLRMTLATADVKNLPDGTVVFAMHAEFGGNVFHFKQIDGVWYIVQVDQ